MMPVRKTRAKKRVKEMKTKEQYKSQAEKYLISIFIYNQDTK